MKFGINRESRLQQCKWLFLFRPGNNEQLQNEGPERVCLSPELKRDLMTNAKARDKLRIEFLPACFVH
jgi:hypothetical protein